MRSFITALLVLLFSSPSTAQGRTEEVRVYSRQDLFVACLTGYVGASVPQGETPDYDESIRIATDLVAQVLKVCPAPSPKLTEKSLTDPDAPLHRWMLMVTRQLVVLARQGAVQELGSKW